MRIYCQDSNEQVTYPASADATAYCGCCGRTVHTYTRPQDTNEIPHYVIHTP